MEKEIRVNVTPESVRRVATSLVKETIDFQQSRSGTFKLVPAERPGQAYLFPAYPIEQTFRFQTETIRSLYMMPNEVWDKLLDNPEAAKLQEPAVVEQIGDGQWRLLSRGKIGDKEVQVEESKPSQEEPTEVPWSAQDNDGDGLTNGAELRLGTDPYSADTDQDGISDLQEVILGTDPNHPDTDHDVILDGAEVLAGRDSTSATSAVSRSSFAQDSSIPSLDAALESDLQAQSQPVDPSLDVSPESPQETQQASQQQAPQTTQARLMAPLAVIRPEQRVSSMVAQKAPLTLEGLQQQIDTLKSEMAELRQSVAEMGQRLDQLSRYEPPTPTADPKLSSWLGSVGAAIRSTSQELSQRLGKMAQSVEAQGLKTQVAAQAQEVRQQTITQVQEAHRQATNRVNQTVADLKAKAVSAAIGHILQHHGQKGPDGSLTLETASLSLRKEKDGVVSVQAKDGRQVMNHNQFSPTATAGDIEKLDRVEKIANADLNQTRQGHAQQQGKVQPKTAGAALSR
jgi:hypothetical protein